MDIHHNKKEWSTNTLNNIGEFQMQYAKWKKSDLKGCVLYDSIYVPFWNVQNCRSRKQIDHNFSDWFSFIYH